MLSCFILSRVTIQLFFTPDKSEDWLDALSDHIKLSNMRTRRLASFDDGVFCPLYISAFSKFSKVATDTVADLINISNKIEKKFSVFIPSFDDDKMDDNTVDSSTGSSSSGSKGTLKGEKDTTHTPVSRGGRMSLDEAEDTLNKISGTYECSCSHVWY